MPATATDVMKADVISVLPTDSIDRAVRLMSAHHYRNLPVVDANTRYLGTVSIHSILGRILPKAALMARGLEEIRFMHETIDDLRGRLDKVRHEPVRLALCQDAEVVAPSTPLLQTLLLLYRSRHSVAVVEPDSGKLMGIISYFDIEAKLMADAGDAQGHRS